MDMLTIKLRSLIFTSAFIVPVAASAEPGSIVISGKGRVSSAPEFVSLSITIKSICYNSSHDAATANAKMAIDALKVLEDFKKGGRDRLTASGGANALRTETTQVGNETRVLCEMKWHAENRLELQMADMASLPDLQDRLVSVLGSQGVLVGSSGGQTYAESSQPIFALYPETSKHLRDVAQGLAYDDGRSQLEVFRSRCAFVNLMLTSITPEFSFLYKVAGESIGVGHGGPVIPDEIEVTADLRMQWVFTPSVNCRF
jgi:hypothetical protein